MSKIICDVCGTSFPDSANQCPICGCVSAKENSAVSANENKTDNGHGTYTYVKGGRFSKANVKKRNSNKKIVKEDKNEESAQPAKKSSSKGLLVVAIILFLAIIAMAVYIAITFFMPAAKQEVTPNTTAPATTEKNETEPTVLTVPCEDLTCPLDVTLYEENEVVKLDVVVMPEGTTDTLTFASSDETIVTVDEEGNITAIADGEATVEVVCGTKKAYCKVTCDFDAERPVEDEPVTEETEEETKPVEEQKPNDENVSGEGSNSLLADGTYKINTFNNGPDFSLYPNNSHELVLKDANGNNVEFTLTSKTPGVCTVDGNKVYAVAPGNGTVIIRFGDGENDFFKCEVIVWRES